MIELAKRLADRLAPPPNALPGLSGRAFVLGSAPRSSPPAETRGWTYATVNGSQAVLGRWGLRPDVALFGRTWRRFTPANLSAREAIAGMGAGHLICVGHARNYYFYRRTARKLPYAYDRMTMLTPELRLEIVGRTLGAGFDLSEKLSNGVILALLCLDRGASEVAMSGFSLTQNGHAYNDRSLPRQHVDADRLGLAEIRRLGLPVHTNDEAFAQESGLELRSA